MDERAEFNLKLAEERLIVSKKLLDDEFYMDSVNRSYYAIFYTARALVAKDELDLTVKVFISTNRNFDETEKMMRESLKNIGVKDTKKYISNVIRASKLQFKHNESLPVSAPSWKPPKPSQTDYKATTNPCVFPMLLPNIHDLGQDFSTINWDWLSEFDKDEIMIKKIIREL